MNVEQLQERLAAGGEQRNFELKGPLSLSEKAVQAKIARAVLGMANHRDGGHIVIGIDETVDDTGFPRYNMRGLDATAFASWSQDNVRARMAEFADPHVEIDVIHLSVGEAAIVVLRIYEFSETPVLARKEAAQPDGKQVVRKSALYVRGRGKVESVEAPTSGEMRDVIDLAVEKRLRSFIATASRAGVGLAPMLSEPPPHGQAGSVQENGGHARPKMLASEYVNERDTGDAFLDLAQTRGFWHVCIAPARFTAERVKDLGELDRIARSLPVSMRGWNFPTILPREKVQRGMNWVGQSYQADHHVEFFRFFQSGQFLSVTGVWEDWRDASAWWPADDNWKQGQSIGVVDVLFRPAEVFELASRLSLSDLGDEDMIVEVRLSGIKGRQLLLNIPDRAPLMFPRVADIDEYRKVQVVTREQLSAGALDLAHEMSADICQRFGWDINAEFAASLWDGAKRYS